MSQRKAKRARQEARAAVPTKRGRSRLRRAALPALVLLVVAALVGGYFAARHKGPAGPTRVTHGSDGALEIALPIRSRVGTSTRLRIAACRSCSTFGDRGAPAATPRQPI
jgi:hypothetical protein